jgi:hypothetical protein
MSLWKSTGNVSNGGGNLVAEFAKSYGTSLAPEPKRTEPKDKNLRPLTRPSRTTVCGNLRTESTATPQQRRFAVIGRLAVAAAGILDKKPDCSLGDLAEGVKQWAANQGLPYFDAWPGAATPVQAAITIAIQRREKA